MEITWIVKPFDALAAAELYAIMQLRNEVFVVEQNCAYADADNKDQPALHLMGWKENILAAYLRIIPPGISYREASIGRVVTSPACRGGGIGRVLMEQGIAMTFRQFNCIRIKIGAQLYLQKFYASLGFVPTSEVYLDDNIPHIEMLLEK